MHALQALKNRGVLAVDGQDLHAVLLRRLHDERAARDERFLVRERELLLRAERCERRLEADHADDRIEHDVGFLQRGERAQPFHAAVDAHVAVPHGGAQLFCRL